VKPYYCRCGQAIFCENTRCGGCGRTLSFEPLLPAMISLDVAEDGALLDADGRRYRPCANREQFRVCNGVVDESSGAALCSGCRLNRTVPVAERSENILRWKRLEAAKRRMLAGVSNLGLDVNTGSNGGLRFDFLEDKRSHPDVLEHFVSTGHKDGVITINVLEADEISRVQQRELMGERYRTVLGHCRHEAGHFFYQHLVRDLGSFTAVFGDPALDYDAELRRYYDHGPEVGWEERYISSYASSHPLEDWAECFAHFLHIEDTLETAICYGLAEDPGNDPRDRLIRWAQFVIPLNELGRSLGQRDHYPFILTPVVIEKLLYVQSAIAAASTC
jgi:hypothetical protein